MPPSLLRLRPHCEHRAFRQPDDAHGCAPEENMLDAGMSVRSNNDQIDLLLIGLEQDFLVWLSGPDDRRRLDATTDFPFHECLQLAKAALPELLLHLGQHYLSKPQIGRVDGRLDDVNQPETRSELLGQGDGVPESILRVNGEINRDKDPPDGE